VVASDAEVLAVALPFLEAGLRAGDVVTGPAIVTEMDSTTLVLPGHVATVHPSGSLLITPLEG
jgi:N-methylhydantoinase A